MARTAKARILRSTQTSPNAGDIRDLETTFGAAANKVTTAAYATGGLITWKRFKPNATSDANTDPAGVSQASAQGWRDSAAEHALDQVRFASGTWTVKVRISKSGQIFSTDITVRVVAIVFRVTSSGTHIAEIGRVTMSDTTIAGVDVPSAISGSFSTGSPVTFNAGDKIQCDLYITAVAAGSPAAPAQVNIHCVVDEASANGASFTAQPNYDILYARALVDTEAVTTDSLGRALTATRALTDTEAVSTDTVTRTAQFPRGISDVDAVTTDTVSRATTQARTGTESAPATDAVTRATTQSRTRTESAQATDAVARATTQARARTESAPATDSLSRIASFPRGLTDTDAVSTDAVTRAATATRSLTDTASALDSLGRVLQGVRSLIDSAPANMTVARAVVQVRALAESAPASDAVTRVAPATRALVDSVPASDSVSRLIIFGRGLSEEIGTTVVDLVPTPSKLISGTVRDQNGVVVSGATVKLFRQADDRVVRVTTSAADGTWSFVRDVFDQSLYYTVVYKTAAGVGGVSDRDLVPV